MNNPDALPWKTVYKIAYRYLDPHGSGPFKGSMETHQKVTKGDEIYAPFGRAQVTSCRLVKEQA